MARKRYCEGHQYDLGRQIDEHVGRSAYSLLTSGRDGTFSDTTNSIVTIMLELSEAVPVNAGAIVFELVDNGHFEVVPPIAFEQGSRVLVVDQEHDLLLAAIWCECGVCNLECSIDRLARLGPFLAGL